ncbi:triple tyrosine motif-containing protein, partial [Stenotrophomonas sp.]|uniref:triple tyrosine motif-containing protein n=1 Tax=Stenotrophomonas sp. TaxID=69392 RepID=UPI002FCB2122
DLLQASAGERSHAALASAQPLWVADWEALILMHGGRRQVLDPPGVPKPRELRAVLPLGADEAWFCFGNRDVVHYLGGQWRREPGLPAQACSTLAGGRDGEVLLGYPDGSVRIGRPRRWRHLSAADGLAVGPITAAAMIGRTTWVAGENGLALLGVDGRFHPARSVTPGLFEGITGIVRDGAGQLWLNGSRGLVRIAADTLAQAALAGTAVEPRLFDTADGMPGIAVQTTPVPSAMLAADGLLWLSTNQGLAWVDTRAEPPRAPPPVPHIGNVSYGDRQQPLHEGSVLPPGTTQLQIDYMAVSLSRPERTRYRYRLIGLDERWQDAGTLTRAFYTNLPPGDYRFEVVAANQDQVWSTLAAQRRFRIAPMWYQTLWFNAACVVVLVALLLLAMRLRSRRLTQLVRARLQERHAERERIARELHDTLLQGTQGLILRLHAVSQASHTPPPVRAALEDAMQQAENALAEGRDRVSALRDDSDAYQDLGAALVQVYGERAADASSPALRLNVEGTPMPLRRAAAEEVYLIGREAVLNALQHAAAGAIEIDIGYGLRGLRVHIRDDGRGLPDAPAEGHWGLVGMRERAERLGARLRLWSRPGLGTEVELFLPRHRIYRRPARRWRWPRPSGDTA